MHVIIAGSGDLARYICEEFTIAGHTLVILTRQYKPHFERLGVTQFITDYTLTSLSTALSSGEVLISTISDFTPTFIDVHRTLIQACQQSPKCKRFIPSEFAGDVETYPDQPGFYYRTREPIRAILREQTDLEWTLVSNGWLADYLVPAKNRFLKDIDDACPVNLTGGSIVIPGTGTEPVDFTWARDVAKALAQLVVAPAWEPYTYISGERSCWNDVARLITSKYRSDFTTQYVSLYNITQNVRNAKDDDMLLLADHHLFSVSHAGSLPQDKVHVQREKYFRGIRFRTLEDGLAEYDGNPEMIL
ncbi:hypothetical protein JDV02_004700 [Purpureocillium takamizusanense]|uniref:NmrA-like domain-containing protein n=1 Tax=Purpureocillium takamizusanense TaxID=2060973 RepID=A0A9Q8QFU4_9HYPO|nr:uncharacterized protein JDV02_004700 [Purpureocillium takamizusanense]UNI18431.1 hypothetical protein JDV02_004700 [Purpureocillium takamizusanense]